MSSPHILGNLRRCNIILAVVVINLPCVSGKQGEKAIEAPQAISAATSKVIRDGKVQVLKRKILLLETLSS